MALLRPHLRPRLRPDLRPEDLALAVWLVVAPILFPPATDSAGWFAGDPDPVGGLLDLVAVVGALACVATRPLGGFPAPGAAMELRLAAVGPFAAALALVGARGLERLGVAAGDLLTLPVFVGSFLAVLLGDRTPTLAPVARRALLLPFLLVAGAIFQAIAGDLLGALVPVLLGLPGGSIEPEYAGLLVIVIPAVLAGAALFYAMLVFAPRYLADAEGSRAAWYARFALFLVGASIGIALRTPGG